MNDKGEFEQFEEAFGAGVCYICGTDQDIWRTEYGLMCYNCAYDVQDPDSLVSPS